MGIYGSSALDAMIGKHEQLDEGGRGAVMLGAVDVEAAGELEDADDRSVVGMVHELGKLQFVLGVRVGIWAVKAEVGKDRVGGDVALVGTVYVIDD